MAVYGSTGNGELYHWKYIKKYWTSKGWRYVYKNDPLKIKSLIDTKITGKAYTQHMKEVGDKIDKLAKEQAEYTKAANANTASTESDFVKKTLDEWNAITTNHIMGIENSVYVELGKEYEKSLYGKIEDHRNKTADAIVEWLEKLSKKN